MRILSSGRRWPSASVTTASAQYYDPVAGKGVVFVFKPDSGEDTKKFKLRGVDPKARYTVTFEDKSNPDAVMAGAALLEDGLETTLKGKFVSELVFLQKEAVK